jgi:hypothetical protein
VTQTIILSGSAQRFKAKQLIDVAPPNAVVKVDAPRRTVDQNSLMWALLSTLSRAKPEGRTHTPEVWKALMMNACGYEVQFLMGLDGNPFPHGFRSSKLSKDQMSELIEFIHSYAARHGVALSDEVPTKRTDGLA